MTGHVGAATDHVIAAARPATGHVDAATRTLLLPDHMDEAATTTHTVFP